MQLVPWKKTKATQRTVIIILVVVCIVQNVVFFFSLRNKFRLESTRQQGTSICEEQGNCTLFVDGIFNATIVTHENTAAVVDNKNHLQHAPGGAGRREPHSSHVSSNKNTITAVSTATSSRRADLTEINSSINNGGCFPITSLLGLEKHQTNQFGCLDILEVVPSYCEI